MLTVSSQEISLSEESEDDHDLSDCDEPELCFDIQSKGREGSFSISTPISDLSSHQAEGKI